MKMHNCSPSKGRLQSRCSLSVVFFLSWVFAFGATAQMGGIVAIQPTIGESSEDVVLDADHEQTDVLDDTTKEYGLTKDDSELPESTVEGDFGQDSGLESYGDEEVLEGSFYGEEYISESAEDEPQLDIAAPELGQQPAAQPASSKQFVLEEVVVTARKTTESLQDTPIAVTAFNAQSLEDAGITNLANLNDSVPGLVLETGVGNSGAATPFIRGVGQRENKATLDPAVAIYVDGVYLGRPDGGLMDLVDLAAVEVLRGPQGTLFGKNATGGALVLTTNRPAPEFEAMLMGRVGNYSKIDGQAMINYPITENIFGRVSVSQVTRKGFTENLITGKEHDMENRSSIYAQVRYLFEDESTFDIAINSSAQDEQGRGFNCRVANDMEVSDLPILSNLVSGDRQNPGTAIVDWPLQGATETFPEYFGRMLRTQGIPLPFGVDVIDACKTERVLPEYTFYQSQDNEYSVASYGLAATYTTEYYDMELWGDLYFESLTFKSITSHRFVSVTESGDMDGTRLPLADRIAVSPRETAQWTQEFNFVAITWDSQLTITSGLYYWQEATENEAEIVYVGPFNTTLDALFSFPGIFDISLMLHPQVMTGRDTNNKSWAAYSQFNFDYSDNLQLTFGLRYTYEKRWTRARTGYAEPDPNNQIAGLLMNQVTLGEEIGPQPIYYGVGPVRLEDLSDPGSVLRQTSRPSNSQGVTDSDWTPLFTATYFLPEDFLDTFYIESAMTYFTMSKGYRSGGIVSRLNDRGMQEFKPEVVNNLEVGLKLQAFDNRLRANMAAYFMDYKNMQLTLVENAPNQIFPITILSNAGHSQTRGFEGEFTFAPFGEIMLIQWNVSVTDPEYIEYVVNRTYRCENLGQVSESGYFCDIYGNEIRPFDRSDEIPPAVSKYTSYFAIQLHLLTPFGLVTPRIEASYKSEQNGGFDRLSVEQGLWNSPERTLYNARVSLDLLNEKTRIAFYVKNATNEYYTTSGSPIPETYGVGGVVYGQPRFFGLEVFHNID